MFDLRELVLREESLHPPALDAVEDDDEEEIPWVLLDNEAFVAYRRNATTAYAEHTDCGGSNGRIQASLLAARPPRVSYICVFYHRRPSAAGDEPQPQTPEEGKEEQKQMFRTEPMVVATDGPFVLLRMVLDDLCYSLFVYQPGGDGGPLLTRLDEPPNFSVFSTSSVGIVSFPTSRRNDHASGRRHHHYGSGIELGGLVSCPASRRDDHGSGLSLLRPHRPPPQDPEFYMVAALCEHSNNIARGRFTLFLYNSKLQAWTDTNVSVDHQHFEKYNEESYLPHINTKVIVAGGEDATIAFVDLWRGILLCDLARIKENSFLRYVPLPHRSPITDLMGDSQLSRDIAVVNGQFKYVRQILHLKTSPFSRGYGIMLGWKCDMFTRPVIASSLEDDSWEPVCSMDSSGMDIESRPGFELLPRLEDDEGRPLPPFKGLSVTRPMLSLDADNTVCFMVKKQYKSWVMVVDMENNRLLGVNEFDLTRYFGVDIAYQHSNISSYLKRAQGTKEGLKRKGMLLLPGSSNKKAPWWGARIIQHEMEGMVEGGDDPMLE